MKWATTLYIINAVAGKQQNFGGNLKKVLGIGRLEKAFSRNRELNKVLVYCKKKKYISKT